MQFRKLNTEDERNMECHPSRSGFPHQNSGRLSDEDLLNTLSPEDGSDVDYLLGLHCGSLNSSTLACSSTTALSFADIDLALFGKSVAHSPAYGMSTENFGSLQLNFPSTTHSETILGDATNGRGTCQLGQDMDNYNDNFGRFTMTGMDFTLFDTNMDMDLDLEREVEGSFLDGTSASSQFSSTSSSSSDLFAWANMSQIEPVDGSHNFSRVASYSSACPSGIRPSRTTTQYDGKPCTQRDAAQVQPSKIKRPLAGEDGNWTFINSNNPHPLTKPKTGVRRGHLPPTARKKARRIREIGACWKCWVQKVPCSEGLPCETCVKHYSGMARELCCRTRLVELVPTFFPEYLTRHLGKRRVIEFMADNVETFTGTTIEVALSVGMAFEPMVVKVDLFKPQGCMTTEQYHLITEKGNTARLVQRYSAPLAIKDLSVSKMKAQSKRHVEEMIASPGYASQVTAEHSTRITAILLEMAKAYDGATDKSSLVHDALLLHGIHYYMGVLPTLSEYCRQDIQQHIDHTGVPMGEYLTSRLLNRQIKYVMQSLHQEIYQSVLEGLEKLLKSSAKKESWCTSFCTLIVLCLCMEELQTAAEIFVMSDDQIDNYSIYTRRTSLDACSAIEKSTFLTCLRLFHDVYRSSGQGRVIGSRGGGLNPFRKTGRKMMLSDLDDASRNLIESVQMLYQTSYLDIVELASRPLTVDGLDLSQIKNYNTSRMAARLLMSFLDSDKV